MEEESGDPLPLSCHREKMPPSVSSPSAQLVCSPPTAFQDSVPGTPRPCSSYSPQFSYSPQWFPHLIPTGGFDDEETMISCTLWNWSDDGGQIVSVETMMAGMAMSNHAAAEPAVASGAALSPLRPQNLQPMNLDITTTSSKEASGPSTMGDEVAPVARRPPSRPLPSCKSPSMEHILLAEASHSLVEANDATSVAMTEQGNNVTVEVPQSKEQLLLRIQTMMETGLLAQKNQGQLLVLQNFLEFWCTQPNCAEEYYAQAQHSGALGSSVPRSNAQAQHSGSKPYARRAKWKLLTNTFVMCIYCRRVCKSRRVCTKSLWMHASRTSLVLHSSPKTPQKIEIVENPISLQQLQQLSLLSQASWGWLENPISLSRKKESENENKHIELGNSNMEIQPGDMSRNHTDEMEIEPGDMTREPIVDMDVDSAKVKDVSQSNDLYPLIEGSSSQVENIPGNFSMLDAAIGIKESRQNEDKVKVTGTPRSGENGGDNELNEVDQKDVKLETGDASRKRKKCASESEAWLHFTKVLDSSGVVTEGMCKYCGKFLKAHPKTNGTSRLRRHAKDIHGIELKSRSPKTKKSRVAPTTKAKVTQSSECCGLAPDKVPLPSDVIMLEDSGDTVDEISRLELQLLHRINSTPEQEVLVQINDVKIKKKELESLADSELEDGPPRYLRDDIIDAYIYILKDKRKDDTRAHGKVYIETTVGCQQLSYMHGFSIRTKKNRGIKYLKHEMIFLPIHQNRNHWYLAVINTKKHEVQVLDSKKQFQERKELKLMLKKMEQCLELASNEVQSNSWPDYKLASWKVMDESQIPKQIDMSSCGLYMIKYMEYWTGEKMSQKFTQADIELFRLKLAAELLSSPLNKA